MTSDKLLDDYAAGREDDQHEFKSVGALDNPRVVASAVCSFLNSNGGEVVVGLKEENGGFLLDPLPDWELAKRKLTDSLASLLAPHFPVGLRLEKLECSAGGAGLLICVPAGKELYAVREKGNGSRTFTVYQRAGDRKTALDWPEIRNRIVKNATSAGRATIPTDESVAAELSNWVERMRRLSTPIARDGGVFLVLKNSIDPPPSLEHRVLKEKIFPGVIDPTTLGIRGGAWHYASGAGEPQRSAEDGMQSWYVSGNATSGYRLLEFSKELEVRFSTRLVSEIIRPAQAYGDVMGHPQFAGLSWRPIHPRPLLETIHSCIVLHHALISTWYASNASTTATGQVWVGMTMTGMKGARLGRPSIDDPNRDPNGAVYDEVYEPPKTPALIVSSPLDLYMQQPGKLVYDLAAKLYAEFGQEASEVPFYNRLAVKFDFASR